MGWARSQRDVCLCGKRLAHGHTGSRHCPSWDAVGRQPGPARESPARPLGSPDRSRGLCAARGRGPGRPGQEPGPGIQERTCAAKSRSGALRPCRAVRSSRRTLTPAPWSLPPQPCSLCSLDVGQCLPLPAWTPWGTRVPVPSCALTPAQPSQAGRVSAPGTPGSRHAPARAGQRRPPLSGQGWPAVPTAQRARRASRPSPSLRRGGGLRSRGGRHGLAR